MDITKFITKIEPINLDQEQTENWKKICLNRGTGIPHIPNNEKTQVSVRYYKKKFWSTWEKRVRLNKSGFVEESLMDLHQDNTPVHNALSVKEFLEFSGLELPLYLP